MRTKHGYGNKAAGIGNTGSGWIASTKVILFKEMFEFLVRYHGSANKARTEIDIKSKDFVKVGGFSHDLQTFLGQGFKSDKKAHAAAFLGQIQKFPVFDDTQGSLAEPPDI